MLARLCSKSFKLGFSSMWTENFQTYKLGFKEAEELEIKLPTFVGWWRKQRKFQRNICFIDYAFDWVDHNKLECSSRDHLTCLLRNLYAGQEATVRTRQGTTDWFQIGKGVWQGCILSPCLFNLYAEYIMWNARLDESQAEIKIAGRNINSLKYTDDTTLMAESEKELKTLLMKVKKLAWNSTFKKAKIMSFGPIISWQIEGEKHWSSEIFFSWALKSLWAVIAAMKWKDPCSLEGKLWQT